MSSENINYITAFLDEGESDERPSKKLKPLDSKG